MIGQVAIAMALLGFYDLGLSVTPLESYHLAAARRVKLWSLNANLLFEEPQQLTKFA